MLKVISDQEEKSLYPIRGYEIPSLTFLGFANLLCVALADEP